MCKLSNTNVPEDGQYAHLIRHNSNYEIYFYFYNLHLL
jgi:hypothetical protein